jgi:hypothetical protein
MQFLAPIFDGLGWTFRLIGGGRTGGAILGVASVLLVVWAVRFWRNAHWQPGRPMRPEIITQLREHKSTVAAGLRANMEKPLHPIFDDQVQRLQIFDEHGTRSDT